MWSYQVFYICIYYYWVCLFIFISVYLTGQDNFQDPDDKIQQGSRMWIENEVVSAVLNDFLSFNLCSLSSLVAPREAKLKKDNILTISTSSWKYILVISALHGFFFSILECFSSFPIKPWPHEESWKAASNSFLKELSL